MGRVFEAFKRAERAPFEPRTDFNVAYDSATTSPANRVVGFNRPQRADQVGVDNGRARHFANAEMLDALTRNDEDEHYVEDLMNRRAVQTPDKSDGESFAAKHDEEKPSSVIDGDKSGGDKSSDAVSGEEGLATAPPAPLGESGREARRRRIAEMLQAARAKETFAPVATDDAPEDELSLNPATENSSTGASDVIYGTPGFEPPSQLFASSKYFKSPSEKAAEDTTSVERIEDTSANGSALPLVEVSHVAGATTDVGGAARVALKPLDFPSIEVSAARVEPHLIAITEPHSPHTERFRALRTRVLHAGEKRGMKSFVITSANPSEGKTLTALNLAWLLAQTEGVRALLIDADLRQPSAADYLDVEPQFGLSEILDGHCKLTDAIVRLQPSGLHLLSGGASQVARDRVAEMFAGPTFNKILAEAREMFDYVIMDAPPLGVFTDASLLINRADGALLVVRAGKTRYAALDRLLEPLPRERILGVVLNGSDEPMTEGNSYYYYKQRDTAREAAEVAARA